MNNTTLVKNPEMSTDVLDAWAILPVELLVLTGAILINGCIILTYLRNAILHNANNLLVTSLAVYHLIYITMATVTTIIVVTNPHLINVVWCQVLGFLMYVMFSLSANSCALLSGHRFFSIIHPQYRPLQRQAMARKMALLLWIYTVACCSVIFMLDKHVFRVSPVLGTCVLVHVTQLSNDRPISIYIFITSFLLPFCGLVLFYWRIYHAVLQHRLSLVKSVNNPQDVKKKTKRISQVVITVFLLTWAPYYVMHLVLVWSAGGVSRWLHILTWDVRLLSCILHPLLYTVTNHLYSGCVLRTIRCKKAVNNREDVNTYLSSRTNIPHGSLKETHQGQPSPGQRQIQHNNRASHKEKAQSHSSGVTQMTKMTAEVSDTSYSGPKKTRLSTVSELSDCSGRSSVPTILRMPPHYRQSMDSCWTYTPGSDNTLHSYCEPTASQASLCYSACTYLASHTINCDMVWGGRDDKSLDRAMSSESYHDVLNHHSTKRNYSSSSSHAAEAPQSSSLRDYEVPDTFEENVEFLLIPGDEIIEDTKEKQIYCKNDPGNKIGIYPTNIEQITSSQSEVKVKRRVLKRHSLSTIILGDLEVDDADQHEYNTSSDINDKTNTTEKMTSTQGQGTNAGHHWDTARQFPRMRRIVHVFKCSRGRRAWEPNRPLSSGDLPDHPVGSEETPVKPRPWSAHGRLHHDHPIEGDLESAAKLHVCLCRDCMSRSGKSMRSMVLDSIEKAAKVVMAANRMRPRNTTSISLTNMSPDDHHNVIETDLHDLPSQYVFETIPRQISKQKSMMSLHVPGGSANSANIPQTIYEDEVTRISPHPRFPLRKRKHAPHWIATPVIDGSQEAADAGEDVKSEGEDRDEVSVVRPGILVEDHSLI